MSPRYPSFFRTLSGNACLIYRQELHRWHHLCEKRDKVFNSPDTMSHKIQLLGSSPCVLKHCLCPVQMPLPLSKGNSQRCSYSHVTEGFRLSPVQAPGKGQPTLEASAEEERLALLLKWIQDTCSRPTAKAVMMLGLGVSWLTCDSNNEDKINVRYFLCMDNLLLISFMTSFLDILI